MAEPMSEEELAGYESDIKCGAGTTLSEGARMTAEIRRLQEVEEGAVIATTGFMDRIAELEAEVERLLDQNGMEVNEIEHLITKAEQG